ncbi:MAG: flagellar biosynthesis protein FlhA [Firmicutes bacterium]|nr:flagellar biosynthesis protein FlhA [Bacillota bacterium]
MQLPNIGAGNSPWKLLLKSTDILAAVAFIFIVAIIIIPITPSMLDILLTINIAFALIILLITLFTREVRQLNVFPAVLLMTTLFRLALNISSTRLILSDAAAGKIIAAFGEVVVRGNYIVGFIIFLIITLVQFIVITNGASRIAEVAARFSLDAMPGRQMSIDADFNAGLIDEETARQKRIELQKENDFYGSMDGASKFVRGDAIAGVVIVLINILGGLAIGMLQKGMTFTEATHIYTILTVGDGLVAQIPALLISTSAGMLVARSTADASFGEELSAQIFSFPRVILVAAALLLFLGMVPGLPAWPFLILGAACGALGATLLRESRHKLLLEEERKMREAAEEVPPELEDMTTIIKVEVMEIEIGYNLVTLTDTDNGGNLLERITAARRRAVSELGFVIQPIRIRDNLRLQPNEYRIKLKGNEVGRGEIRPGLFLALNPDGEIPEELEGIVTHEPTFNLPALWITEELKDRAESMGCTVVDSVTVMITHLTEIIRNNAHELVSRQTVKEMLDKIKESDQAVVEELVPEVLSMGDIQKVFQNLLQEKIPLHDMVTILETLADQGKLTKDPVALTEAARQGLSRTITNMYTGGTGVLKVITLDPALEKEIADSLQVTSLGSFPVLDPLKTQKIMEGITNLTGKLKDRGISPVILTSPRIRFPLRQMLGRFIPHLPVLSINEILPEIKVEAVGVIVIEN